MNTKTTLLSFKTNDAKGINADNVALATACATDAGRAGIAFLAAHTDLLVALEEQTAPFTLACWSLAEVVPLPGKIKSGPWAILRRALIEPAGKSGGSADRLSEAMRECAKSGGKVTFAQAFGEIRTLEAKKAKAKRAAAAAAPTAQDQPTEADADTSEQPKEGVAEKGKFRSLTIRSDAGAAEVFALMSAFAEKFGLAITLAE